MDWFKGKSTGNYGFSRYIYIWGFPVKCPLNQSIDFNYFQICAANWVQLGLPTSITADCSFCSDMPALRKVFSTMSFLGAQNPLASPKQLGKLEISKAIQIHNKMIYRYIYRYRYRYYNLYNDCSSNHDDKLIFLVWSWQKLNKNWLSIEIDTSWNILPITQVCSEENIHLRLDCRGEFWGLASKGCSPSK